MLERISRTWAPLLVSTRPCQVYWPSDQPVDSPPSRSSVSQDTSEESLEESVKGLLTAARRGRPSAPNNKVDSLMLWIVPTCISGPSPTLELDDRCFALCPFRCCFDADVFGLSWPNLGCLSGWWLAKLGVDSISYGLLYGWKRPGALFGLFSARLSHTVNALLVHGSPPLQATMISSKNLSAKIGLPA